MHRLQFSILLFLCFIGYSQELPPIINYSPKTYQADNQNWMISQADNDYIYVANNKGLLEFNGAQWNLYPSPNETIVRSVKAIGNKIYTGCYMDFGYWETSDNKKLYYTSLSEKLGLELIEDEQFWNIIAYDKWILFQSLSNIYIYDTALETTQRIEAQNTIIKLFKLDKEILFQIIEYGIYTIENGEKKLISNHPIVSKNRIVGIYPYKDKKLIITQKQGLFLLDGDEVIPFEHDNAAFIKSLNIYNTIQLDDGSYVLGTISHGIVHLNTEGELEYHIDQARGLANNTALSLFEDKEQNVWIGLDNGIACINAKSPFMSFIDREGSLGTIYTSIIHNGNLYLGTNQGLFYKPIEAKEEFKLVKGTSGQVWSLKVIDNQLFCGHDSGTFLIDNNISENIAPFDGTWELKAIPNKDNMILQGNYNGLHVLVKDGNRWKYSHKLKNFDKSSRYFEWIDASKLIVNHEYKGVFELRLDSSYNSVLEYNIRPEVNKGANSGLINFKNNIYYENKEGFFKYDMINEAFKKDTILSKTFGDDQYSSGKLIVSDDDILWSFTENFMYYTIPEKLNNTFKTYKIRLPQSLRNEMKGYENIIHINDKEYLLGTSNGYITLNLDKMISREYQVQINSIEVHYRNDKPQYQTVTSENSFHSKLNNIVFQYSIPEYNKYEIAEYQYKLDDLDTEWSNWTTTPSIAYENLSHGTYKFNVRARVGDHITNAVSYTFSIDRPWYLSNLFIILYVLGGILLFTSLHTYYNRYYKKQQKRLLEKTKREIEIKELETQKEIIQLKNNQLNQDIESKNRELAISTMNMIKKNEILNTIKQDLRKDKTEKNVETVIRFIDKSINNNEDWKFFEEAFNHADKNFFKKVKEMHPKLTANDLRLCAYLRLNLSSKEIAPLLNISVRSVEIKRYRLRKKIDLPREINLNDYFLNL